MLAPAAPEPPPEGAPASVGDELALESVLQPANVTTAMVVPSLDDMRIACLRARAQRNTKRAGTTLAPVDLPNGSRLAACDDPQGAAFGLVVGARGAVKE